jgi:hypothetical protein
MKNMIIYPFMSAIMLVLAVSGNMKAQDLSFTIKPDKTNYKKGEPVKCVMTLINNSKKDLVVNNRFLVNLPTGPLEVSLVITDPDNHLVPFTSLVRASFDSDEFITLGPGKTTTNTYTLTNDFDLITPGNYSILAYYQNKSEAPASLKLPVAWKGTLLSNKTYFSLRW